MPKVYIFDVDGTLTPSRRKMTKDFEKFFIKWSKNNPYWLVSGSNIEKMDEQVPEDIMIDAQGLFCCGGNELWEFDPLGQIPEFDPHTINFPYSQIYEKKFEPPKDLIKYLEKQLKESQYFTRCGNHIEDRGSMINFSIVGRDCTLEERKTYFEYDNHTKERQKIATEIRRKWSELDAVIGGQISIDIAKKSFDKSQVIFEIMHRNIVTSKDEYIFIGDRTEEGGNDYPLAKAMKELGNCRVFQAGEPAADDGYIRTREILESLND